jgi:peptidoglycan/LPS O-acetylase OafA/YrhL
MPIPVEARRKLDGRIPELDGLRGVAILLDLIWHYVAADPTHQFTNSLH